MAFCKFLFFVIWNLLYFFYFISICIPRDVLHVKGISHQKRVQCVTVVLGKGMGKGREGNPVWLLSLSFHSLTVYLSKGRNMYSNICIVFFDVSIVNSTVRLTITETMPECHHHLHDADDHYYYYYFNYFHCHYYHHAACLSSSSSYFANCS